MAEHMTWEQIHAEMVEGLKQTLEALRMTGIPQCPTLTAWAMFAVAERLNALDDGRERTNWVNIKLLALHEAQRLTREE